MKAGDRLGRYTVLERLGAGAHGEVWRARQGEPDGFSREVALKLLHGGGASERLALADEARAGGALRSPHLVETYDFGETDGQAWLALQWVEGPSLARVLASGRPLPPAVALDIALHLCRGLAVAHRLRLVHRDLKPANILLDVQGVARLSDFGIALSPLRLQATSGSAVKGTPRYMAPEQWRTRELGPQADLFALGCVLWEMLSGQVLFDAADLPALLDQQRAGRPQEEAARVGSALPGIEALLALLLSRDPAERPSDARRVESQLQRLRDGFPGGVGLRHFMERWASEGEAALDTPALGDPPTTQDGPGPSASIRRSPWGLIGLMVVGAGLVVGGRAWWRAQTAAPAGSPPAAVPDTTPATEPRPSPTPTSPPLTPSPTPEPLPSPTPAAARRTPAPLAASPSASPSPPPTRATSAPTPAPTHQPTPAARAGTVCPVRILTRPAGALTGPAGAIDPDAPGCFPEGPVRFELLERGAQAPLAHSVRLPAALDGDGWLLLDFGGG